MAALKRSRALAFGCLFLMWMSSIARQGDAQDSDKLWQPVSLNAPVAVQDQFTPGPIGTPTFNDSFAGPSGSFEHRALQQRVYEDLPQPQDRALPRYERMARLTGAKERPFLLDVMFFGRANVEGPATSVKMIELGGAYMHRFPIGERFLLTLKPFAGVVFLSGPSGPTPILPEQLYRVGLDVQGDLKLNEMVGLSVGVSPGFWTDFVRFSSDDVRLPARALLTAKVQDGLFVAGGVHYTDNIRRNLLPAIGILWDPIERVRVEVIYPRGRLIYFIHDEWQAYTVIERGGDTYNLRTPVAGTFVDEDFEYRDVRFLLGTQYDAWKYASVFLEAGVSFARKFRFDYQPEADVDPAFVLRVGARF